MRRHLVLLSLLLLVLSPQAMAGNTEDSTTTLTIDPSATSGTTITASDVNNRSNDVSTWADAHVHSLANTTSIGDGAAGNKNLCFDAADATDMCIRFDDTNNMLLIDSPVAGTFGQILKATGTAGLTTGGVLVGGGTGEVEALAVMTNGQLLIGDGNAAPTLATLTQGTGITITNGAGSITIAASSTFANKVVNFTRDTTDASGTQAVTGVGFNPSGCAFIGTQQSTREGTFGFDDTTNSMQIHDNSAATDVYATNTSSSIHSVESSGNDYAGEITATGSDGFTITWTKTGSPTGTLSVMAMCFD